MAQVLERAQEMLDPAEIMPRVIGRYSSLHIDHGKGIYVWDVNGERYADFTSGIAVVNTGHCHPARGGGDPGPGRAHHPRPGEHPGPLADAARRQAADGDDRAEPQSGLLDQ